MSDGRGDGASAYQEERGMHRVFVVGLDGGTLDLLGPWMQEGRLPHLQQLMEAGVSGELESTIPPQMAVAWSSCMTGKNAGKHGLFDFIAQEKDSYEVQVVDSRFRRGKALWDIVTAAGIPTPAGGDSAPTRGRRGCRPGVHQSENPSYNRHTTSSTVVTHEPDVQRRRGWNQYVSKLPQNVSNLRSVESGRQGR
jgi:hypothetical protein